MTCVTFFLFLSSFHNKQKRKMDSPPIDNIKYINNTYITDAIPQISLCNDQFMKHSQESLCENLSVIDVNENEDFCSEIPKTMRGIQLVKYGPLKESLQYNENIPVPKLDHKKSQVLVQVKSAGVNPIDIKVASGNIKFSTLFLSLPTVIGADFSGFVVDKTDKVVDFDIGDQVCGTQRFPFSSHGTHAQYTLVDIDDATIAKKPKSISFDTAAAAGVAVITAYQGIIEQGRINNTNVHEKRNILIVGASGGVGNYAVQFAKATNRYNTVIAICSAKNASFNLAFGADRAVDYNDKQVFDEFVNGSEQQGVFDIIFDCIGGDEYFNKLRGLLKGKDGVYCSTIGLIEHFGTYGKFSFSAAFKFLWKMGYRSICLNGRYTVLNTLSSNSSDIFKDKILPVIENKKLVAPIIAGHNMKIVAPFVANNNIIPLEYANVAYTKMSSNHSVGKIILSMD